MRHTLSYIGTAFLLLVAGACTDKTDSDREQNTKGTPLMVRAELHSGEVNDEADYKAFAAGKQIHIYYAHNNLENTYNFLQGIYQMPDTGNKTSNWIATEWTSEGGEQMNSIYLEDIKTPNSNNRYYFTATSYPEPRVAGADGSVYEVAQDQTKLTDGFEKYDFLAARAIYSDEDWKDASNGITLHFRHLLCQLRVQLILPKGTANDGFFPNPANASIETTLAGKRYQYTVTFNNRTETGEIFGINIPESAEAGDLKMRKNDVSGPSIINSRESYIHTFAAILPKQTLYGGKQILFTINGDSYSYTPPTANTILLEQEKITTIQLTVLSGSGKQKVTLDKVTLEDWKEDKADIGDLTPQ